MKHDDKVNYLRIAMGMCHVPTNKRTADLIICLYEECLKKGGDFSLRDAVEIEIENDRKYKKKELEEGEKD